MNEEQETVLIHVLISLAVLLFAAAKLFAEVFHKFRSPLVLGSLYLF
jgi:hypothetical protein